MYLARYTKNYRIVPRWIPLIKTFESFSFFRFQYVSMYSYVSAILIRRYVSLYRTISLYFLSAFYRKCSLIKYQESNDNDSWLARLTTWYIWIRTLPYSHVGRYVFCQASSMTFESNPGLEIFFGHLENYEILGLFWILLASFVFLPISPLIWRLV